MSPTCRRLEDWMRDAYKYRGIWGYPDHIVRCQLPLGPLGSMEVPGAEGKLPGEASLAP